MGGADPMDPTPPLFCLHYLRTPEGAIYGPVDQATLCLWAVDARMIPGCELSTDRVAWVPVQSLPELRLNWSVQFNDGTTYGPLNLLAIWTLASEKSIPFGVALVEAGTPNRAVLDDSLLPLLVQECRAILGSCGTTVAEVISKLGGAHQKAQADVADREARIEELQAKLEQADFDRGNQEKLLSEAQCQLVEANATAARMAILESEGESLRAGLVAAHSTQMTQRDAELAACQAELAVSQAELTASRNELETCRTEMADLQRQMTAEKSAREALEAKVVPPDQPENVELEKDLLLARQREEALSAQLSHAREALARAKQEGRIAAHQVKDEKESILRDLNNLMLANLSLKQVSGRETVRPAAIDWVVEGTAASETDSKGDGVEARFARLTLNEKFAVLQKELQASAGEKELMRRELENIRGRYDYLQKETSRREKESAEKLAQIKKEIKTSSDMMARAMEELEKRESQLREMRKKAGSGNPEAARRPSILDAEVVHTEVLGPEESGAEHEPTRVESLEEQGLEATRPAQRGGVLNTVEAQLQRELKKWHALKRDEDNKGGLFGNWFRRKKS